MRRKPLFLISLLPCLFASALFSFAQLPPVKKDPLAPAQSSSPAACSTTDASSCAQVASKLLPLILGPSPMEENLRRLINEIGGRVTGSAEMAKAVQWGVAAFRSANIDVHTEKYGADPPSKNAASPEVKNVVGEIRGYEKPDEIVILGAHLDFSVQGGPALDNACNSALVIEAARALKSTGLLPRRTIRFVLFGGKGQGIGGSFKYVETHRTELDKTRAAITYAGMGRVTGYSLGGRRDLEAGVRETLKPLESWDVDHHTLDTSLATDSFDFLLEGVPALVAIQKQPGDQPNDRGGPSQMDKLDMREQKLRTVIAALTAWGIADRTEPLGKRLSRPEIEALLKETGVDRQMKLHGYWDEWQSGARGRKP